MISTLWPIRENSNFFFQIKHLCGFISVFNVLVRWTASLISCRLKIQNCKLYDFLNNCSKGRYTRGSLLLQHAPATRFRSKAPSSAPTISSEKICCATKLFLPSFAPSYQTSLIRGSKLQGKICCTSLFQEQAPPSCVLKFALRRRVSGTSYLVCTCWGTYPGACFGSVFQEQAPSCVLVGVLTRERVSGACFRSKLPRVYRPFKRAKCTTPSVFVTASYFVAQSVEHR